jgi:hypothetical protein
MNRATRFADSRSLGLNYLQSLRLSLLGVLDERGGPGADSSSPEKTLGKGKGLDRLFKFAQGFSVLFCRSRCVRLPIVKLRILVVFGLAMTPLVFCGSSTVHTDHNRESGTLIVWDASPDAVVIAADSKLRRTLDKPDAGDNGLECKIVALGPHLAFAVAGIVREDPTADDFRKALGVTWVASEAMRHIVAKYKAHPKDDEMTTIAKEFGAEYARVITVIDNYDPSALIFSKPCTLFNGESQSGNTAVLWGIDKSKQITIIKINLKQETPPLGPFSYSLDTQHPAFVGDKIAATGSGAHFAALVFEGSQERYLQLQARRTIRKPLKI